MRLKNLLSSICAAFIVALSLIGCSDYDNGYTEQQISFIENFKEIYGEVDSTQDWNLAERAKVTVTVSKPSNVQIYAKANDKYRIVGDYDDVSGTQTLGFDVVEGTTDIMVSDGRTAQKTTVGGSVVFAGTRTIYNTDFTTKTDDDHFLILTDEEFIRWSEYVPEKQFNLGKVTEDFIFVSTGPFTIYPVWWNTSNNNELGIYILGDDGKPIEKPIYQIKPEDVTDTQGNSQYGDKTELMYWAPGGHHDENGNWQADAGWAPATGGEPAFTVSFDDNGKLKLSTDENSNTPSKIRARGITVNLEPGTLFGMYLRESARSATGKTYYSNSRRNEKYYGLKYNRDPETGEVDLGTIENDHNSHASYACTFTDGGRMYLGFEDWEYLNGYTAPGTYLTVNNTDFDLNDCLFVFGDDTPEIVDLDAQKWIISAEDLGNTLDIDYNDVVIEVEHTSGRKNAYVTPLAAGGTLASFVYFNDIPVGSADYGKSGEIHELFSSKYAKEKSGEYEPINVNSTKQQIYSTRNYTIEVGRNWSLASYVPDYEVYGEDGATLTESFDQKEARTMGGFNVRVVPYGKDVNASNANDANAQRIQNNSTTGEAPFVICTPKYWTRADNTQKGHYRWPMESVHMFTAYRDDNVGENEKHEGHTFQKWVADKDDKDGKVWYQYPNAINTCAPTVLGINPEDSFKDIAGSGDSGSGGDNTDEPTGDTNMFLQISRIRNGSWTNLLSTSGGFFNGDIDFDEFDGFDILPDDQLSITINDYSSGTWTNRKKVTATYDTNNDGKTDETYTITASKFLIEIPTDASGLQTITLIAESEKVGEKEYGERTITITFTIKESGEKDPDDPNGGGSEDNGDDITEKVGEGSQENQWSPIIYTISKDIFSKYASDVTLSFYIDLSKFQNNLTCVGKIGGETISYNYFDQQPNNPLQITLTEDRLAKAKAEGMTIECGIPISDIYIKGTPASAKRRISNHR